MKKAKPRGDKPKRLVGTDLFKPETNLSREGSHGFLSSRIIRLIIVLFLIALAVFLIKNLFFKTKTEIKQGKEISQRGEDFLKNRQENQDEVWSFVDFESNLGTKKVLGVQTINAKGCFSFEVPFEVTNFRGDEENCNYYFAIQNPKGELRLYRKKVTAERLEDEPGVKLRLDKPDTYQKEEEPVNGVSFLTFRSSDPGQYQKIAFYLSNENLFVLSLIVYTTDNIDNKFTQALGAISFEID
ncbi:hypothetical protein KKD61_01745 [Patescibacteria group bacterium]|nr:hypothetical protein [Patescibacteria group bacterium]